MENENYYNFYHSIVALEAEVEHLKGCIQSENMGQVAKKLIGDTSPIEEYHKNNINKFQEKIDEINDAINLLRKY